MFCLERKGSYYSKDKTWTQLLDVENIQWHEVYVTASQDAMKLNAKVVPMMDLLILMRDSALQQAGFTACEQPSTSEHQPYLDE